MNGSSIQRTARWTHLAVLLLATPFAAAANFTVAPVRLEFAPDQRAVAITLNNADSKKVVVEARVFLWEQVEGQDKLTPSADLIVTPALAEVPANSAQLIRVGRRSQVQAGPVEKTYRVVLQEVVPSAEAAQSGITFALRMSLPAFIAPKLDERSIARAVPAWTLKAGKPGELLATVSNSGTKRLQIIGVEAAGADGKPRAATDQMFYVLAGKQRSIALKAKAALPVSGTVLTLKANTDAGEQVASVPLTNP